MSSNVSGHCFVLGLYAAPVTVAGVVGYLIGTFVSGLSTPRLLFLVPLPPTPVSFAAYGALIIVPVFGVPLALVVYTSANLDDAA